MTKTLSKEEIRAMDEEKIDEQILAIKKILFEFRMKQATKQSFKPHILKIYKRQLAQIMTIQHEKFQ
uniref:Large ribosomal subunit protein uL29c n=1 Tax=Helminthocladia australis TaxID=260093 RepID=A0A1G4NTP0_9FLOR|nr:Ribosomal protein L29 [Helminthocladia australis]SCW22007.1 Ribosomal protein L29 [Helminthocladia australis]